MFTGIIEEIGVIKGVRKGRGIHVLSIQAKEVLKDLKIGDSIAVNGACQTVTSIGKDQFSIDTLQESLNKTTLGSLKTGSLINLERAMSSTARFGGHYVQGHINGIGKIRRIITMQDNLWLQISLNEELINHCISEGSITIDGISLTIAKLDSNSITVNVIPETLRSTVLKNRRVGDPVNIETDIFMRQLTKQNGINTHKGITMDKLKKAGF